MLERAERSRAVTYPIWMFLRTSGRYRQTCHVWNLFLNMRCVQNREKKTGIPLDLFLKLSTRGGKYADSILVLDNYLGIFGTLDRNGQTSRRRKWVFEAFWAFEKEKYRHPGCSLLFENSEQKQTSSVLRDFEQRQTSLELVRDFGSFRRL